MRYSGKTCASAESIAHSLLATRLEAGMTQSELAEATHVAQADISRYENGRSNPTIRTLERLADAMGADLVIRFDTAHAAD